MRLLLTNPKSCFGIVTFGGMVLAALLAPVIAQNPPDEIVALPGQPPNRDFWFGTTDQGYDVFAQVIWGARISLAVGAAAAVISTVIAATLGMLAAYVGGWIDDTINMVDEHLPRHPGAAAADRRLLVPAERGPVAMVLILGLTTWAVEARILRSQALTLRNRDFVQAAKVSGEGTWRIVFGEIMPNMISRIAAGFLLVFYLSIIFAAGLEFLGFGDVNKITWGTTLYWAQNNSSRAPGRVVALRLPGRRARARGRGARVHQLRRRRAREPAAAAAEEGSAVTGLVQDAAPASAPDVETEVLLELDDLVVDYLEADRSAPRRRPRQPDDPRGRDRRPRRRVGLRQDHDRRTRSCRSCSRPREVTGGRIRFRGVDLVGLSTQEQSPLPLAQRLDGLPERDERAQPGHARRRPVRGHDAGARARRASATRCSGPATCSTSSGSTAAACARTRTSSPAACVSA